MGRSSQLITPFVALRVMAGHPSGTFQATQWDGLGSQKTLAGMGFG